MESAFLVPLLPELGLKSAFSITNPIHGMPSAPPSFLEVALYRDSRLSASERFRLEPASAFLHSERNPEFVACLADPRPGDLAVLRILDESGNTPAFFDPGTEGQIFLKPEGSMAYATVITGFVPHRPKGHKFTPITHYAHYLDNSAGSNCYMIFCNYSPHAETDKPEANRFASRLITSGGALVREFEFFARPNSTRALSVRDMVRGTSVEGDRHVNIISKGGASQFSILTVLQDEASRRVGVEHSLPPYYYTRCLTNKAHRETLYKVAFKSP